jgi:predicted TIM-barrel fold metal-dependent hydrolase
VSNAADLAAAYPAVVFCLDHLDYPSRRDREYFKEWATALRRLGRVDNTIAKVSALGTFDREWTVASLRPWVLECIDVWGPHRVVFGSNWPIDRLYSSYGELIAAYRDIVSAFSVGEQEALLSGNARRLFSPA